MTTTWEKLYNTKLKEAHRNTAWAKKTAEDKKWMRMASEDSKRMLQEILTVPESVRAESSAKYLVLRAKGQSLSWGQKGWIDPTAREEYKKIVGRYPTVRR